MFGFFCIFTIVSNILNEIAKHHKEWISMVRTMGAGGASEDIVQDAYIRIHKYATPEKIIPNGNVNKAFMFVVLRNMYMTHCKESARFNMVELSETKELIHEDNLKWKQAQYKFDGIIEDSQEDWHWYDKMLFNYYKDSGKSLREIEEETGISLTSLWNTIKNCKARLKETLGETYQDLINEDYELI